MPEENELTFYLHPNRLCGEVTISGAKNCLLCLMPVALMTSETVVLDNYPETLLDAIIESKMLVALGKSTKIENGSITISEKQGISSQLIWNERSIRSTLQILGALIARNHQAAVPLPGGCPLGDRKYDLHVMLFQQMGAVVYEKDGMLCAEAPNGLTGTDIYLPIRSTGATENAIICGCLARGITRVWNPHIRPEILNMIQMLNSMGGKITVFGQEHIEIVGVEGLHGTRHRVIPDNMEALTWLIGTVVSKGELLIHDFPYDHLEIPLIHLRESGAVFHRQGDSLEVRGGKCYPVEISTGAYPGINSDMQPLFGVYAAYANGDSSIADLRFPGRYGYAEELQKMGCECDIKDVLKIHGHGKLKGGEVTARDLRCGAALLLASLSAEGPTTIHQAWQIERGYDRIIEKMQACGNTIKTSTAD